MVIVTVKNCFTPASYCDFIFYEKGCLHFGETEIQGGNLEQPQIAAMKKAFACFVAVFC